MATETTLDLKKTINLPKTGFAQKANLAQSEPARLTEVGRDGSLPANSAIARGR